MVRTIRRGRSGSFGLPADVGLIIEILIVAGVLGLVLIGGLNASEVFQQQQREAVRVSVENMRDVVEYGCDAGLDSGTERDDSVELHDAVVAVQTASDGSSYEVSIDDGSTLSVDVKYCEESHICAENAESECSPGSFDGGTTQVTMRYENTDSDSAPEVVWAAPR